MMETRSAKMGLSSKEILAYLQQFDSAEECVVKMNEDVKEFINDVQTLTESIGNLYEASKVALALGGVEVHVEVTGMGEQLYKARIGDASSADALKEMLKKIAEEAS